MLEMFDRWVARWSGIVGLIASAGAVVSFTAGVLSEIKHLPTWARMPLFVLAVLAVVVERHFVALRL